MALVDAYGLPIPGLYNGSGSASLLLDAAGEKAGLVFAAPKTGTIRKVLWRTGAVTTATDTDCSLQNVSAADGYPDGTADQTVTIGSASITATSWITADFGDGTGRSVTVGDLVAFVIAPQGTPNFNALSGSASSIQALPEVSGLPFQRPYGGHYTAAWAKAFALYAAVEYSDGTYAYCPGLPCGINSTRSVNTGSTPDEVATRIYVPFAFEAWGVVGGARAQADFDIVLYNAAGTALRTVSFDKDVARSSITSSPFIAPFSSPIELSENTEYWLAIKPTTSTNVSVDYVDFPSSAVMGQINGGTAAYGANRSDAGAWTTETTRRYFVTLIASRIHDGAAGGGGGGGAKIIGG